MKYSYIYDLYNSSISLNNLSVSFFVRVKTSNSILFNILQSWFRMFNNFSESLYRYEMIVIIVSSTKIFFEFSMVQLIVLNFCNRFFLYLLNDLNFSKTLLWKNSSKL